MPLEAERDDDDDDDDMSGTTLELPGRGDEEVGDTDSDESSTPQGCSQRKDAWWGEAYNEVNRMDRLRRVVIPVETLYQWWVDGEPSGGAFQDTFSSDDLQYPSCCLQMFGWLILWFVWRFFRHTKVWVGKRICTSIRSNLKRTGGGTQHSGLVFNRRFKPYGFSSLAMMI